MAGRHSADVRAALRDHGRVRPQSKRGRISTRIRGDPDNTLTRRISVSGRNMRPRLKKRGAKSVISMPWPCVSNKRVLRMAVFGLVSLLAAREAFQLESPQAAVLARD